MWLPWLRNLTSTPMTGFISGKGQFFRSKFRLPLLLLNFCAHVADSSVKIFSARPSYRKRKSSSSTEFSVRTNASVKGGDHPSSNEAPAMLVPTLAPARSVREAIQEVKMVQVCFLDVLNSY